MTERITQEDLDRLADIIWWITGFIAGAEKNYKLCPFDKNHIESLRKTRANFLQILKEEAEIDRK